MEAAAAWYDEQSTGLGLEFLRAVTAVFAAIGRAPATYPHVRAHTRRALLRRFPYGVFFRETDAEVVVLAVVHRDSQSTQSSGGAHGVVLKARAVSDVGVCTSGALLPVWQAAGDRAHGEAPRGRGRPTGMALRRVSK